MLTTNSGFWDGGAAAATYQEWTTYPDSPVTNEDYPYQCIIHFAYATPETYLAYSPTAFWCQSSSSMIYSASAWVLYKLVSNNWEHYYNELAGAGDFGPTPLVQANNDIYTDATFTAVYFSKTT